MKKLKIVLHSKKLYILLFLILIIYCIYYYQKNRGTDIKLSDNSYIGIITNYKIDKELLTLEIKGKENVVCYYYFKTEEEMLNFNIKYEYGDSVLVTGKFSVPNSNTVPNLFNYKRYLKYHHVHVVMNCDSIIKVKSNNNLFYKIKNLINNHINNYDSKKYLGIFILGNKNLLDSSIYTKYQSNGVSHLFSISGMHISLLSGILLLIFKRLHFSQNNSLFITLLFLIFYMFLSGLSPSTCRSVLLFSLVSLNKVFKLDLKNLNLLILAFIILIFLNPYYIFDLGFIYSFTICFSLIALSNRLTGNYFYILFFISFTAFLVSLPITLFNFYEVNFLSIILNLFFVPFVSIIIFPLAIITFFIPFLDWLFYILAFILEALSSFFSNISIFMFNFGKPSIIFIIFYYVLLILFFRFRKKIFAMIIVILLVFQYNINYLIKENYVIVLDVGQGDSIFFHHGKTSILIDTGGKVNLKKESWMRDKKSLSDTNLIPYFKSIGIRKLNYLILTHGDYDHMGEAINLVNNFKVEKVVFNCGPYNNLEQELIKVLDKKNIKYYSCIKELNIDNNKLYFLQTKEYDNENDNSNVIYTNINGYRFMFMGDASIKTEKEIMNKYNLNTIDVLKVGHHGSKTSSGKEFINKIEPKYSIISVGKNNRYGHPNKEVLNTLDSSKIYRTDQDGSIMFKIKNKKINIETCSP